MDYITRHYKTLSENLQRKLNLLEAMVASSDPNLMLPPPTFDKIGDIINPPKIPGYLPTPPGKKPPKILPWPPAPTPAPTPPPAPAPAPAPTPPPAPAPAPAPPPSTPPAPPPGSPSRTPPGATEPPPKRPVTPPPGRSRDFARDPQWWQTYQDYWDWWMRQSPEWQRANPHYRPPTLPGGRS